MSGKRKVAVYTKGGRVDWWCSIPSWRIEQQVRSERPNSVARPTKAKKKGRK